MSKIRTYQLFLLGLVLALYSCEDSPKKSAQQDAVIKAVDASLFSKDDVDFTIKTVDCTLNTGEETKCFELKIIGTPADHEIGPWCPETIEDGEQEVGFWFYDGKLQPVNGNFIKDLSTIYNDGKWLLYDENGNVFKTNSKEDCIKLAGAKLIDDFENHCIECLTDYVADLTKTFLIPITPTKLESPFMLGGPPKGGDAKGGGKPKGPPPGGKRGGGPQMRGVALNGVVFDAPAPVHLILSGYTIPPIDHAGGHINMDAGYHYHAATGVSKEIKQPDGHAPMIGYALDGYGLFAHVNEDGSEPSDLDECRGHYDEIRGYHYHVDHAGNNNFINCFRGAIAN